MPTFMHILAATLLLAGSLGSSLGWAAEAQMPAATLTIHADRPGARIDKYLYGQFAEHLGRGIYEGVWVGESSKIPNTRGYRNDVIAALKQLRVPVVRWPGGCFADEYHWREGIGPLAQRPVKINTTWGGVEESNAFGTHEFLDFAELIGADAYVAGNVGSGTPTEMAEWVEYITSESNSTLAQLRRKHGRERPWRLPVFGVGNETWGCGGNMRPEYFADLYRRFANFIKAPDNNRPLRIASGANVDDYRWTEVLLSQAAPFMDGYSLHYYTFTERWEDKGPATGFSEQQWAKVLRNALRMDELVSKHSAIMDKYDPEKRVALYVDEWGTWYEPEVGRNPAFLYQQNTLRDALVAALTLGVLHSHSDRVRMSSVAQMVNVLQAMILTEGERMVLTPTYHVFEMFLPFQDATYLPTDLEAPQYRAGDVSLPAVQASAARTSDGGWILSLVNLDPRRPAAINASIVGAAPSRLNARVLSAAQMDARNTFAAPDTLQPATFKKVGLKAGKITATLPAMSVVVMTLK